MFMSSKIKENWPDEVKTILNKLTLEDTTKIVDFVNTSYLAGFFDGEGGFIYAPIVTPTVVSQDIECLQLYLEKYGGCIGLQTKKGKRVITPLGMDGEKVPVYMNANRNIYYWRLTGGMTKRKYRSFVEKTNFIISLLPLQHNPSKIDQSIKALLDLKWSSRIRWENLIPKDVVIDEKYVDMDVGNWFR